MQYKRIMGVDFGNARIGIAFSDLLQMTVSPFENYQCIDELTSLNHLNDLAKNNDVELIVIGLPYNMDGSEGERAVRTKEFANKLQEITKLKVEYQDERLSSVEAEEILRKNKVQPKERKKSLDKLSAAIILQSYINEKR